MGEEFACPHCGKNLGPSQSPANATLMCPYCQQFFTMSGGVETAAPEVRRPAPKPAKQKSVEDRASKVESSKSDTGDLRASAAQAQPLPEVLEPLSKPEILSAEESSHSITSSAASPHVGGESDTLKAIAPEDRANMPYGPRADMTASSDRKRIEPERITSLEAVPPVRSDGVGVSPYIIPQVPTKTGFHFIGVFVISVGVLSLLGSVSLAIILTANYSDFKPLADHFKPVIEQVENFQTVLKERFDIEFIMTFPFQLIVVVCLVIISLVMLWSGVGLWHKKKSALMVLILLIAIVSVTAILVAIPPASVTLTEPNSMT